MGLQAAQRGSAEMEQRKWHFVVETFSCSDSFRSGHHELIPGRLMKASGPKEHLSLTSASRCLKLGHVRVEVEAVAARKVCLSLCKSHICKFECQTSYLKLTSSEKDSSFFLMQLPMSSAQKLSRCQRNLTNVSNRGKSAS